MSVDLGAGNDSLTLANGTNTLTVNHVETITGGTGDDTVTLSAAATGLTIDLGSGNDVLNLANGTNTLTVHSATGVTINGGSSTDTVTIANGTNVVTVNNVENVFAGTGADTITVTGTQNTTIHGGVGAETLSSTGSGNMTFIAGTGVENMTGGSGRNTYEFTAVTQSPAGTGDTITNFNTTTDTLLFNHAMFAGGTLQFNSTAGFAGSGTASAYMNGNVLEIDTTGAGHATMEITLSGVSNPGNEIQLV